MKILKYIIVIILAAVLLTLCGLLILFATALEDNVLVALCVAGAIAGAVVLSYLISEVE